VFKPWSAGAALSWASAEDGGTLTWARLVPNDE
jgi:hypothetical protein